VAGMSDGEVGLQCAPLISEVPESRFFNFRVHFMNKFFKLDSSLRPSPTNRKDWSNVSFANYICTILQQNIFFALKIYYVRHLSIVK
jgi:hypothetical protein